ncbi:hypothetical protein K501DRAFT_271880 [Backusella circina FSU 941]|nr:hypothetical protein K501DRAFT_271880 [Backusella circina FSU 941]
MSSALPNEILHKIFIRLNLKQRLACMLVCCNWYYLMDKSSLLYHVVLADNKGLSTRFMDIIKCSLQHAVQLEVLILEGCFSFNFNTGTLYNISHNARVIEVTHTTDLRGIHFQKQKSNHSLNLLIISWNTSTKAHFDISIESVDNLETYIQLYKYITMKYNNTTGDNKVFRNMNAVDVQTEEFEFFNCSNGFLLENISRSQIMHIFYYVTVIIKAIGCNKPRETMLTSGESPKQHHRKVSHFGKRMKVLGYT